MTKLEDEINKIFKEVNNEEVNENLSEKIIKISNLDSYENLDEKLIINENKNENVNEKIEEIFKNNDNLNNEIEKSIKKMQSNFSFDNYEEDENNIIDDCYIDIDNEYENISKLEIVKEEKEGEDISARHIIKKNIDSNKNIELKVESKKNIQDYLKNKFTHSFNKKQKNYKDSRKKFDDTLLDFKNKCKMMLTTQQIIEYHTFVEKKAIKIYNNLTLNNY